MKQALPKTLKLSALILGILMSFGSVFAATPVAIGTNITNVAYALYQDKSGNPNMIMSNQVVTTVSAGYVLDISKEVEKNTYLPLDTVKYHIELTNSGNSNVSSVTVTDTLHDGLTFVSSQPAATVDGQHISWNLQNIQPGATSGIDLQCLVAPGVLSGTSIENSVSFMTPDSVYGSSEPTAFIVGSSPVLTLDYIVDKPEAYVGDSLEYMVTIYNAGNAPATNIALQYSLPYLVQPYGSMMRVSNSTKTISKSIGDLEKGESVTKLMKAVVQENVNPGNVIKSTATAICDEGVSASDDVITQILEKAPAPEFKLERTQIQFTQPGDTLSYRIKFTNIGVLSASGLLLTDSLDEDYEFLNADRSGQFNATTRKISWTFDELDVNETDSVEVSVIVNRGVTDGTILTNRARITCSSDTTYAVKNSSTMVLSPRFMITKSSDSTAVAAGDEIAYSISYRNIGNGRATEMVIRDTLSQNVAYVSSTGNSHYDSDHHVVTWEYDELVSNMGQSLRVGLVVRTQMPLKNNFVIANTASIECFEGIKARATVNTTVHSKPVLTLNKTAQDVVLRGDTLEYSLEFSNVGNDTAKFVQIRDTLPAEIQFLSADGNFIYEADHHSVSWDIGHLLPGANSTLVLQGLVKDVSSAISEISNTAYIHSESLHVKSNTAISELSEYRLFITADPDTILGDGVSRSLISVDVKNASDQPAPDGTPISLSTELGTFSLNDDTLYTINGSVQDTLTSVVINQEYVPVKVEAKLLYATQTTVMDTVVFAALRIEGTVVDEDGNPVEGAIVSIIIDGNVIASVVTGPDGEYSIPIYASGNYIIRIQYPTGDGDISTVDKNIDINVEDPDQRTIISDLSSISGRLIDDETDEPIRIPDIPIVIDYTENGGIGKPGVDGNLPDTTYTDSSGFWYFKDLETGDYFIRAIFDESAGYRITTQTVDIDEPGENMVNVDLLQSQIIFGAYKTVDKNQVFGGDTIRYTIVYRTMAFAVTDTISVIDMLPDGMELIESSLRYSDAFEGHTYDPVNHELFLYRVGMSPETTDSISFQTIVSENIISLVNNEAIIMNSADTAYTADNDNSEAETLILTPFLTATKSVNRSVAETGDILTYSIKIENRSQAHTLYGVTVYDQMPKGFRYKEDRSFLNNTKIDDPEILMSNLTQKLTWTLSDTLEAGESMTLKYRVIVGLESRIGENINSAQAVTRMYENYDVWSNKTQAEVIVKPGMIQDRGLIFGKVYYDDNGNLLHDNDEKTLKDVEIITEEGIRVITDEYGKYSIPNVRMGDHVLRINEATLPENTEISLSSSDFLGDARSRLVKVSYSGIAKANFPITTLIPTDPEPIVEIIPEPEPEPVVIVAPEPVIVPVDTTDNREAIVEITQNSLTESMRLIVNDSWSMMLDFDYSSANNSFSLIDTANMDKTVSFLKWQSQMHVMISEKAEMSSTASFSFGQMPGKTKTPAHLVVDYLKDHGISANRVYLDDTLTLHPSLYKRIESCEVELLLVPEDGLYVPDQALTMQHDIKYYGELPFEQTSLLTSTPEGFLVDENSGLLNGMPIKIRSGANMMNIWDMGEWTQDTIRTLTYDLIPVDPPNIRRATKVASYMDITTPGGKVLTTGTTNTNIPTRVEMIKFDVTLEGALFDVGSYVLKPSALESISETGNFMQWRTDVNILVEGFTDHVGSEEDNMILSYNRANAVRDHLIQTYGISPERIETAGYGEEFPVADNSTREGRALNRRVEIIMNSSFEQKGEELEPVIQDDLKVRVEKKRIETLNEKMSQ